MALQAMATLAFLLAGGDDDTWTFTVTVEAMHCEECRSALEANLRAIKDARVETEGAAVKVTVPEKTAVRYKTIASALPGDLKLKSIVVTMRAVVSAKGDRLDARAKDSGQTFALENADTKKNDVIGALRKSLADPPKYLVTGELVERQRVETLLLSSGPAKTTWKEEK